MIVRPATVADVPRLVALGRRFRAESAYAALVADDPAQLTALFTQLVEGAASVVLVADRDGTVVGLIALVVAPHFFSGQRTAGEVVWWAEPTEVGAGLALLRAGERWAAEAGAVAIQMIAPATPVGDRVARLYGRRGYRAVETFYQAPVTPEMTALTICDHVLPDVAAYRAQALAQPFGTYEPSPGVAFHGVAPAPDDTLVRWIAEKWPSLTPSLSFVRQSPAGQVEPNYIHTDRDMGDWTAILYLTPQPPPGDGTTFWRWRETGAIQSTAADGEALLGEWLAWRDPDQWEPWHTVAARPNRVVLFPSPYFHSRALPDHYGTGDTARLIHVTFGTGGL